jgi:hypothetical protein
MQVLPLLLFRLPFLHNAVVGSVLVEQCWVAFLDGSVGCTSLVKWCISCRLSYSDGCCADEGAREPQRGLGFWTTFCLRSRSVLLTLGIFEIEVYQESGSLVPIYLRAKGDSGRLPCALVLVLHG